MSKRGTSGKGSKKYGRNKRKSAARTDALSRYVRGLISFEQYARLAGVKRK